LLIESLKVEAVNDSIILIIIAILFYLTFLKGVHFKIMAEEKKNNVVLQSSEPYVAGKTDFSALLKQADKAVPCNTERNCPPKTDEKEKTESLKQAREKERQKKKKEEDDKFRALLTAAVRRDDEDEEDAFEAFGVDRKEIEREELKKSEECIAEAEPAHEQKGSQEPEEKAACDNALETISQEENRGTYTDDKDKPQEPEKEIEQNAIIHNSQTDEPAATENTQTINPDNVHEDNETDESSAETEKEEEKLQTADELIKGGVKAPVIMEFGREISAAELIKDGELLEKDKTIKKEFNPNPPKELIDGHDFNDIYLDDIYNYTYNEQIAEIRKRKAQQREEKLKNQMAEEARLEELKGKRQKKKAEKKAKNDELLGNIKPRKQLKVPDKYPKVYEDPTDEEIDEKTGKPYHYFNFTKTLHNSRLRFLEKIIPVAAIDDALYDKGFLDGVADRQHEKAIRLNNMSPEEQYSRDLRNIGVKITAAAVFVFAVFFKVTFGIIPDSKYETAIDTMEAMDYENAYYQFTELGNKELSVYFSKYSEAKMLYKVGKYEEARDAFTLLLPFEEDVFKKRGMKISEEINECNYQIALSHYYDGDFETAKNIFKEIYTYSDSTQRYYECGFKIAKDAYEDWQDTDDLKKALKYFYRVRKYSTEDIAGYIKTIQDIMYEKADSAYKAKEYETAIDLYSYLALFNYTNDEDGINSNEMVSQCTYRYGLDLYKNRKYESARKVLCEIPAYKDSYVLSKECIYNIAHILYENNPVGSIAEYNKIVGYKDSSNTLYSPRLVMYGEWQIVEMNGSSITPVNFSFYDDGQFKTNKQILSVAISTEASPIYYEWDGEKFVAMDGQYTIRPKYDEETGKMDIICGGPSQSNEYKCMRVMTYEEMVIASDEDNKTETAQETMNQRYQNLIDSYIEKKMDQVVVMNGEDVNIFEGIVD